ncbi:hypothetical protein NMY3_01498 [Candidatus Nitrosocosmicus oleophilus]|uniref:Uncharacterized protein n=1 Tax=Candidatus Nitrosocosmicus oleophilus TaxID=1353260 RepID=A0A654LZL1_9ARCH|nr:hypothetical protein NMY3_01498 [Candidatus Nitrosocosmicus oleophilus]
MRLLNSWNTAIKKDSFFFNPIFENLLIIHLFNDIFPFFNIYVDTELHMVNNLNKRTSFSTSNFSFIN